ncbi:uncharacterized protein LOC110035218 [Phalaenopsis equestris]|uniref:uncharacterized protein LOC110035218 n=1 Tax=Phalaenopsis equestris TaxID=78828 RepID=UPI0009E39AD6|nr:uncharacterized protein LOC110035218 [Phalaenopsis equestris]
MAGTRKTREKKAKKHSDQKEIYEEEGNPTPRRALTSFFTCRYHQVATAGGEGNKKKCKRIGCSGTLCKLRENSKILLRPVAASSPESCKRRVSVSGGGSTRSMKAPLCEINGAISSSSSSTSLGATPSFSSLGGSFRGMHLRRLSGCYECHMAVDPIHGVVRDSSLRTTMFSCSDCGEIFMKSENLELHRTTRHAVSELGSDDNSRNIVEIIFQSSWLKKQAPTCQIDRILKIHNSEKTIARFEEYRNNIKNKASKLAKKYPRCIADGNELLRFHCTTFTCSLGLHGSTNLCGTIPKCRICSIIRDGIKTDALGRIRTMATSGRAHNLAQSSSENEKRGMLVCRVIAGRIKRNQDSSEEFDSVLGSSALYSSLDEIFVFNPKAILPCFVVIYRAL